jgi:hypothetical protein
VFFSLSNINAAYDYYLVNTNAPIDQLAHIRELAPDSPFNEGLVTLGISGDPITTEILETAQFGHVLSTSGCLLIYYILPGMLPSMF